MRMKSRSGDERTSTWMKRRRNGDERTSRWMRSWLKRSRNGDEWKHLC